MDALFLKIKVAGYRWSSALRLGGSSPSKGTKLGTILLDHFIEGGARTVSIYASYWLVNDTGAPCTWLDAGTGKPIPGQSSAEGLCSVFFLVCVVWSFFFSSGGAAVGLDAPASEWYRAEPDGNATLFWTGTGLAFSVGRGRRAAQSGALTLANTNTGTMGAVALVGPSGSRLEFGLQVNNAPGHFWRTKVVQLRYFGYVVLCFVLFFFFFFF